MIDPGWTYVDTTNKVLIDRNELANLIKFDSTKFLIISKEDYNNHPEKYAGLQVVSPQGTGTITGEIPPINDNTSKTDNPPVSPTGNETDMKVTFPSNFVQFRQNTIDNPNSVDMIVKTSDNSYNIPPKSSKNILILGDNSVTLSSGGITKTYPVKKNEKPQINIQRIATMSDETNVTTLQKTVCYRITITDDYSDQLEVKITGPVTFKNKGQGVYDITMNAFGSNQAFSNWADSKSSPYKVGFNVNVTDKISKQSDTRQNEFVFGEW